MTEKKKEIEKDNPWIDGKFTRISPAANKYLGLTGRMTYRSKSMKKPTTIFNANVYNAKAKKIWYGDLEIERDREALIELSNRVGPVYILWEMASCYLDQAPTMAYIKYKAIATVENRTITYSPGFQKYVDFLTHCQKKKKKTGRKKRRC